MRRLLGCFLVSSWLLACGGDDSSLFETGGGAGSAGAKLDSGQHADAGSVQAGGSSGTGGSGTGGSSGVGVGGAVLPDVSAGGDAGPDSGGNAGSGGTTGSDASDVSVAPADASDGGRDATDTAVSDGMPGDTSNADAQSCTLANQCPTPANVCMTAICDSYYVCGTQPTPQGWVIPTQTAGDCKRVVCDGYGSTQSVDDPADLPTDDKVCTTEGCNGGTPTHTPLDVGTPCSGGRCNAQGNCVQCISPADCGQATVCSTPSCDNGTCGVVYTAVDTPLPTQTTGDCKIKVCGALGSTKDNVDDTDKPNDANACTDDTCSGGTPGHTVLTNTSCGTSGVCNAQGACVGCNSPSDCGGADDFCKTRTCNNNTCGLSFTAPDTKLPDNQQTAKDCKKRVCDGSGNIQTVADGTDLPVDTNDCTLDQCSGSTPQNTNADPGATCSTGVCDGAGSCVQCVSALNCPATGNVCINATCSSDHHCATASAPPSTSCGAGPSCSTGQGHLQDKCSAGACVSGSNVTCSPYVCGASACKTSCDGDGDCASGYSCDTGLHTCTVFPKCTDYCAAIKTACVGSNAQYTDDNVCLNTCAKMPHGTLGDTGGNTVGCRITHAGYAVSDPVNHCPHAGPSGAGVCGANCDSFCTVALATCPAVWADATACGSACGAFPMTPAYNASTSGGNSYACRLWHLTAATVDPGTHCPHIPTVSPVCL